MGSAEWTVERGVAGGAGRAERAAQRRWLGVILGFFALQAALWTFAIWRTAGDDSFAVHPDYETRAEQWDATRATHRASQQLGWTLVATPPPARSSQPVTLQLQIVAADGQAVAGVQGELVWFHAARAARPQTMALREVAPGRYVGTLVLDRSGRWQLRGELTRGDDVWLVDQSLEL